MGMNMPWIVLVLATLVALVARIDVCYGQDDDPTLAALPPGQDTCNGVFLTYSFTSREKEYPHVKNVSAQAWAFKSEASILNTGTEDIMAWKMYVGFQHDEILVSADGAVVVDGDDFPAVVGKNGTTLAGNPMADLKTSIDTAGDYNQIQVRIQFTGTQFGLRETQVPMPKTISLENDGFICPKPTKQGPTYMYVCCKKNPKYKQKPIKTKYLPRQNGDLSLTYDVLQSFSGNYLAQVTIDNNNPLGRLDHWNLTWEWMRGEFIYSMKGAYTHKRDISECIYGPTGLYFKDFDFTNVMNCEKRPVISDLPAEFKNDSKVGRLPFCCRNGTVLPTLMDETQARSIFQLLVYKMPADSSRTTLTPPQKWHINGVINPDYKCGPPIRVDPTEFPDPSGLQSTSTAIASWQVVCNISRPKEKQSRCCVSFSAYYSDTVIPCNTCACGCPNNDSCSANTKPLLLPAEALLVPFENRTEKAKAWAKLKHYPISHPLPCPDNCGVSLNWHINSDYKDGWTARITLFNWDDSPFEDWFAAVRMDKAYPGFENIYSFNGTKLTNVPNTIFFQGFPGLNYLMGEVNGTDPRNDPRVPGKQQSMISFKKKHTPDINIRRGDGFPTRVYFNGEECSLPTEIPRSNAVHQSLVNFLPVTFLAFTFLLMTDFFH
ncbi:COBRA domain-containing protein [Cephalotus follicularis]|uniref:COBRA domain-containing protein n=1 Tax=Cephalotus follicularis TaxID=3775 RepID=A0A1Q3AY64_CEPFO|nr:COBRA domain-containing protein [Cephalotus follicularis]